MIQEKLTIREAREARGLTLAALAALAGCHPSSLCHIEYGLGRPGAVIKKKIASALGLAITQLAWPDGSLTWDGKPRRPSPWTSWEYRRGASERLEATPTR